MQIFPETPAYGRSQPRHCGDLMISVLPYQVSKWDGWLGQSRGVGRHREAPMWYGTFDSTRQDCWGRDGIHAGYSMDAPTSLDEVVRKLTLLIDIGNNWVYAFVWLNEGTLHIPLSNEGHIGTMIDQVLCRSTCGHLYQLEVHKLLQCGDQVVNPKGLNGDLEPIWITLLELPVWDMGTLGKPVHEPLLLQVDLSSIRLRGQMPIMPAPHRASTTPSSPHSAMECPSKTATCPSMATELQELLSQAMLDTSSPASVDTTWGNQHQWPWVLHWPSEWKTHSDWRGLFWLHSSQWLPVS